MKEGDDILREAIELLTKDDVTTNEPARKNSDSNEVIAKQAAGSDDHQEKNTGHMRFDFE